MAPKATIPWSALGLGQFLAVLGDDAVLFRNGEPATDESVDESADQSAGERAAILRVTFEPRGPRDENSLDLGLLCRCLSPCEPDHGFASACAARGVVLRKKRPAISVGRLLVAVLTDAATLDREMLQLVGYLCGGAVRDVLLGLVSLPGAAEGVPPDETPRAARSERDADRRLSARDVLGPEGPIAQALSNYEARRGQLEMAEAVEQTLDRGGVLSVEAGPGTGKTFAYLVPSLARVGREDGARAVVCTRTKQLQDQIFHKDLPFLAARIGARANAALLKGRENYLCLRRWEIAVREMSEGLERDRLGSLATLGRWVFDTETGDIEENSAFLAQDDARELWARLCDLPTACSGAFCPHVEECFSIRARRLARKADLVVVNHSLLLSDAAANGVILGKYGHLIVDEAHAFEAAARLAFTATLSESRVEQAADAVGPGRASRRHGWFDRLPLTPEEDLVRRAVEASRLVQTLAARALRTVAGAVGAERRGKLSAPAPGAAELGVLRNALRSWELVVEETIERLRDEPELAHEGEAVQSLIGELARVCDVLGGPADENAVHWYEREFGRLALHVTPLDVAPILASRVYANLESVILTSATLSTAGDFSYLEESLGVADAFESVRALVVESPFAYPDLMRILVPADLPSVSSDGESYADALADLLVRLHTALDRNGLVLFTSYELLNDVHVRIRDRVPTLAQGIDGSRTSLVEKFRRERGGCILLGTDSFWEGVDLPGEELEYVVVTRLPFAVPTDPVFAALSTEIERRGRDAFLHLALPLAVLKLRQGVGRLVRTATDRGVVILTDDRICTKPYGRRFVESLPVAIDVVDAAAVPREAADWFRASISGNRV